MANNEDFKVKNGLVVKGGNIALGTPSATVDGRDVSVDGTKLDTIETGATADQTAAQILTAIKTVDGAGSGLDADQLDGKQASEFVTHPGTEAANQIARFTGDGVVDGDGGLTYNGSTLGVTGNVIVSGNVDGRDVSVDGAKLDGIEAGATADQTAGQIKTAYESNANTNEFSDAEQTKLAGIETNATADQTAAQILAAIKTVDGAGSGLDADLLDGKQASAFVTHPGTEAVNQIARFTGDGVVDGDGGLTYNGSTLGVTGTIQASEDIYVHDTVRVGRGNGGIATNTVVGNLTLNLNTTGYNNVASGRQSLFSNTTGYSNVASGVQALYANTTGVQNVTSGYQSLRFNTTGNNNVATGQQSLYSNTTGAGNVASGYQSLYNNTIGNNNVASGYRSLFSNTTGTGNVASGYQSLYSNTIGNNNTGIGYRSLFAKTTGNNNTAIGRESGSSITTGTNNTMVGNSAQPVSITANNQISIRAGATKWMSGVGTPEGAVGAAIGSMYTNQSGAGGTVLYVKESGTGNTGWVAHATSSSTVSMLVGMADATISATNGVPATGTGLVSSITVPSDGQQYYLNFFGGWHVDVSSSGNARERWATLSAGDVITVISMSGGNSILRLNGLEIINSTSTVTTANYTGMSGSNTIVTGPVYTNANGAPQAAISPPRWESGDVRGVSCKLYVQL